MGPEQAINDDYEVLLIDDVCSFLTPRLVQRLREAGREIVGVYSPGDGPDAKRRLLECGITDVIEADASPDEFLAATVSTLAHRQVPAPAVQHRAEGYRIGVVGSGPGTGVTELSISLATHLSRHRPTVLLDLNQAWPAVAQRLDLPVHPNLRTALDLAQHAPARLGEAVHELGSLTVVGGLANPGGQMVPPHEIQGLIDDMGSSHGFLVADLGPLGDAGPPALLRFEVLLLVGSGSPVGMTRLVRCAGMLPTAPGRERVMVVNRVSGSGHRRDDIRAELGQMLPGAPLVLLPEDPRLERAAWDGVVSERGSFHRSVRNVAQLIDLSRRA
jgi:hypothetical protein